MSKSFYLTPLFVLIATWTTAQLTWSPAADVASSTYGKNHPRIAMDRSGNALVIWNYNRDLMFSKWNGTAFSTPVQLEPNGVDVAGGAWMGPHIATHGDTVYVVYKQMPENVSTTQCYLLRSFDGGATFSTPYQITNTADSLSRFPTVATQPDGNPIVAFMEFDPGFGKPRWVVARSSDYGQTFTQDILASDFSGPGAEVCDCCPGALAVEGTNVAMLYRDNLNDIRDGWAGVSTNGGASFGFGVATNQQNWNILSCPSTGLDGFIIGDTIYSCEMNGGTGNAFVFFSKNSISNPSNQTGYAHVGSFPGLSSQNYPRIDHDGYKSAMVWRQQVVADRSAVILFTDDIRSGFSSDFDTVTVDRAINVDVAMKGGNLVVVWQDDLTATVRYRMATYSTGTSVNDQKHEQDYFVSPNPTTDVIVVTGSEQVVDGDDEFVLRNMLGKVVKQEILISTRNTLDLSDLSPGVYIYRVRSSGGKVRDVGKLIKQ